MPVVELGVGDDPVEPTPADPDVGEQEEQEDDHTEARAVDQVRETDGDGERGQPADPGRDPTPRPTGATGAGTGGAATGDVMPTLS